MKVLAYARATPAHQTVTDQIARAEAWARNQGHETVRLVDHPLEESPNEYPPRAAALRVLKDGYARGLVVVGLEVLGPDLAGTLKQLERTGATVLVVGDKETRLSLEAAALRTAAAVAAAVMLEGGQRPKRPRRVYPCRVQVDLEAVRKLRDQGLRLDEVAWKTGISRSSIVRRLRRERERGKGN